MRNSTKANKILKKCPVCGSASLAIIKKNETNPKKISYTYEFSRESRKTLQVIRCAECTHVFCSPIPKDIYKNYKDVIDKNYLKYKDSRLLSAKEITKTLKKYKNKGRLLDVGCATGDFLLVAEKMGYQVEGLELSKWSSKIARDKGLKIYEQTLKAMSKKYPKRYDVISMWGVIEHFEKPFEEMTYVNKLLKKDGLLVLWTGDVESITSKVLGRKWWYWQGQHIQYFSHKSLNMLASSTGFKHISTSLYPQAMSFDQINNSLNRYKFKDFLLLLLFPFFMVNKIWYLKIPGEMFWIGKKK